MAQEFSPKQLEKLLRYASQRLNTTPEALVQAFQQGGLNGIAQQAHTAFSPEEAARAQSLLQQGNAAQLMNDPQVQKLLEGLLGEQ